MLAVSLDAFADYQRGEAWAWEHMALTRARPVFGSPEARKRASAVIADILDRPRDQAQLAAEAARMRDEIARHKRPSGPLDVKLGEGGLIDLEFAIHVLQLVHKAGLDPRLEVATRQLAEAELIPANIVEAQKLLTEILVTIRLLAPETASPAQESCELMARACGAAGWGQLLARHDEARQSISELWQRVRGGA
jgi:glutamate-ammonia-ligase adenylyltransferase